MKQSIRINLFAAFTAVMAASIVFCAVLQLFLLEPYYEYSSRTLFARAAERISLAQSSHESSADSVQMLIEDIDRTEGISVMMTDEAGTVTAASYARRIENHRLPKGLADMIAKTGSNLTKKPLYATDDETGRKPRLVYICVSKPGTIIILSKPLEALRQSARIAVRFYLIAGIVALAAGSIVMFRFSGSMTKPIVEMNDITHSIAELDFSRRVNVRTGDEIGQLGSSINTLSDKLKDSIDGLKKDIEFQKTLSRNISHELKTPIGVIKGYAEGLEYGVADTDEKKNLYLDVIVAECNRMDSLVKDMLMLSRLSAKNYVLTDVKQFFADGLFADLRERFSEEALAKGMSLAFAECGALELHGNYELVFLAVSNLVSNALKYTDDKKIIRVNASSSDGFTTVSVYNTCAHIPEDELPKLFDEFYRLDEARTRENSGHGLGLAIVKSIAQLHGGSASAHTAEEGIEFTVSLPQNSAEKEI
jgi:two-component system, OmpR family, sensor histidine kinase VanS